MTRSGSVQRRRPMCGVIGFDTLAILTVARLIVMFDRVVSRSLALLGQIGGSPRLPPERLAEIDDEVPILQAAAVNCSSPLALDNSTITAGCRDSC